MDAIGGEEAPPCPAPSSVPLGVARVADVSTLPLEAPLGATAAIIVWLREE